MLKKLLTIPVIFALVSIYFNENLRNYCQDLITSLINSNSHSQETVSKTKLFTADELKSYNGVNRPELYLVILGQVFDVTKGEQHYGPGQSYHFFIGKDASKSFITGQFEGEPHDEVDDLSPQDLISLDNWVKFYHKDYNRVGKLIGTYYDNQGKLTSYGRKIKELIKSAQEGRDDEESEKKRFPPCNMEWDLDRGGHVWCTDKSGGIDRDWVGYPRKKFKSGSDDFSCVCVNENDLDSPGLKEYENCDNDTNDCYYK